MYAAHGGHSHTAHELLEYGADPTATNLAGASAFSIAVTRGSKQGEAPGYLLGYCQMIFPVIGFSGMGFYFSLTYILCSICIYHFLRLSDTYKWIYMSYFVLFRLFFYVHHSVFSDGNFCNFLRISSFICL